MRKNRINNPIISTFISKSYQHNKKREPLLLRITAETESQEDNAMSEIVFLTIAASAAAFKAVAIVIGIVWAFRNLLTQHTVPLVYRYTRAQIPYLSGITRK